MVVRGVPAIEQKGLGPAQGPAPDDLISMVLDGVSAEDVLREGVFSSETPLQRRQVFAKSGKAPGTRLRTPRLTPSKLAQAATR